MKPWNRFVYRYDYGFGIHEYRIQNWVKLVLVLWLCIGLSYGGWRFWNYLHDRNACYAPYHLVYTGTAPVLVGKVVVVEDQYACVAN